LPGLESADATAGDVCCAGCAVTVVLDAVFALAFAVFADAEFAALADTLR
jgi:hypothetical protein